MEVKVAPVVRELLERDESEAGLDALAELWRDLERQPLTLPVRRVDKPATQKETELRVRFSRD